VVVCLFIPTTVWKLTAVTSEDYEMIFSATNFFQLLARPYPLDQNHIPSDTTGCDQISLTSKTLFHILTILTPCKSKFLSVISIALARRSMSVRMRKTNGWRWEIPPEGAMRVPGIDYGSERLLRGMGAGEGGQRRPSAGYRGSVPVAGMCRNGRGGRRMNRWHTAVVLAAFMIMQAVVPTCGVAGGVIKYHVKVKNDIPITFDVNGRSDGGTTCTVYLDRYQANSKSATLFSGATYTFTVDGPNCPHGLSGDCTTLGITTSIYRRCLTGKEDTWDCTAACWSSDWFIRIHQGTPYGSIHFDKE
jgi:hypothetical protein